MTSDSGLFQCVALNPAGNIQASASLKVLTLGEKIDYFTAGSLTGQKLLLKFLRMNMVGSENPMSLRRRVEKLVFLQKKKLKGSTHFIS